MTTPPIKISDEAIEAYRVACKAVTVPAGILSNEKIRAGLEAVAPLIAAQVLRAVAQDLEDGCEAEIAGMDGGYVDGYRCATQDAVVVLRERSTGWVDPFERREPENGRERSPAVGRCGDRAPTLMEPGLDLPPTFCALPAGHAGWHRDERGCEWSPPDDPLALEMRRKAAGPGVSGGTQT